MSLFPTELMPLVTAFAGAGGGIVAGMNVCNPNELHLPFVAKRVKMGLVGDAIIGFAAGIVVLILPVSSTDSTTALRAVPLGLLAGIAGNRLLVGMSNVLLGRVLAEQEKLGTKVDQMGRVTELIREGEKFLTNSNPRAAEELFRQALAIDSRNPLAHLDLAKSYRHQADQLPELERRDLMRKAIESLTLSIETSPRYDRAYYNRACYRAITQESAATAVADLKRAIELFPGNRDIAVSDSDFASLRDDASFRAIVEAAP